MSNTNGRYEEEQPRARGGQRGPAGGARLVSRRQNEEVLGSWDTSVGSTGSMRPTMAAEDTGSMRRTSKGDTASRRVVSSADAKAARRSISASDERATRTRRQPARKEAASSSRRQPQAPQRQGNGRRVHIVVVILLLLVAVGASVFVTRAVLSNKVQKAEAAAKDAQAEVARLTSRVTELSAAAQKAGSTTGENDTSSSDSDTQKTNAKTSDGVESPWVSSGTWTSGDATLDEEVKAFCDGIATPGTDVSSAALEVYKGVAWSEYVERDEAQHPSGADWRIQYARMYYENGCSGNCYEFAAFLSYCLQYMGFSDAKAEGVVIEFQSGSWGDHGLVYVTNTDGQACLCDTSRGTDGWMLSADAYNVQIQDFENA